MSASYQPKVYRALGGLQMVVASGGELNIESGGAFKIAGVAVTASAADLNGIAGGLTYTNNATFTVDNDNATGKFQLKNTVGGTDHKTVLQTSAPAGGDITLTLPASTGTLALTTDTATNLDLGSSGVAGSLDLFPTTAAKGKLTFTATDSAGDTITAITNDSQAAARNYKIPDAGGHGKFVMTTAANSLLVNANGSDRTMSLNGNVTLAGGLTTTGAFTPTLAFPASNTYTFPAASGTLLTDPGTISGTTTGTFTVDSDSAVGTLILRTNAVAGTNHSVTLQGPTTTQAVVLTLPDVAADTLVGKTTTDVLTNKTLTAPVLNGATTAAAANNFTLNTGSGAFTTPTGTFTFYGHVATNGNNNYDFSASSGAFSTSTGANTLSGNVTIPANKTFDASASSGTFKTSTGTNTIGGTVSLAANKDIACAAGTTAVDFSLGTGIFKTTTNTNTFYGACVLSNATTPSLTTSAGMTNTGFVQVNGKTSGGIKVLPPDTGTSLLTIGMEAQTQACTFKIPDLNVATGQFICANADFTVTVNPNAADRTVSLSGNLTIGAAFTTGANALTLTTAGVTNVTLPTSGTLATIGGVETLTAKVIDGDDNTLQDISPPVAKAVVVNTTPSLTFALQFLNTGAETQTYTVPAGKTLRVLDVWGYKSVALGNAGDSVQIKNAGTAITDAISLNIADNARFAAGTLDDAQQSVAAGAALTCVTLQAGVNATCRVTCLCVWA